MRARAGEPKPVVKPTEPHLHRGAGVALATFAVDDTSMWRDLIASGGPKREQRLPERGIKRNGASAALPFIGFVGKVDGVADLPSASVTMAQVRQAISLARMPALTTGARSAARVACVCLTSSLVGMHTQAGRLAGTENAIRHSANKVWTLPPIGVALRLRRCFQRHASHLRRRAPFRAPSKDAASAMMFLKRRSVGKLSVLSDGIGRPGATLAHGLRSASGGVARRLMLELGIELGAEKHGERAEV